MALIDSLPGVEKIIHDSFQDERGELFTIWNQKDLPKICFNHDKVAISKKNVLRGLHTDKSWKLITCLSGVIQLVIVNYDEFDLDYLNYMSVILDANTYNKTSILVPPGFLNGHLVLSNEAIFHYKWAYDGEYPDVGDQKSVRWSDPKIGIKWLIDNPILSDRDSNTSLL